MWGFGDVTHSNHNDIAAWKRLYDYFPLATHLIVEPAKVNDVAVGVFDGCDQRSATDILDILLHLHASGYLRFQALLNVVNVIEGRHSGFVTIGN